MDKDTPAMYTIRAIRKTARPRILAALFLLLASGACAPHTEPPARRGVLRRQIVSLAVSLAGIPYVYGGSDIDGFDCSGLVFYVYDCFGIRLPRSAREQARLPWTVRQKHAAPGDILVFKLKQTWHSAIYLGEGRFVHAPNAEGWVRLETLNEYWSSRLQAVIAVLPGNG
jgi:cell wall-associated NlpC family hydrolase